MGERGRNKRQDGEVWLILIPHFPKKLRYVTNLIIGVLDGQKHKPFLLAVKFLERTNHQTIAKFVNDSLRDLINADKLLFIVTDGASYMLKAIEVWH